MEGGEDFCDLEGSFSFCGEFWVNDIPFEIFSFKPYFISNDKRCEFGLDATFHGLSGELMGGRGFISCFDEFIKLFFYGREVSFVGNVGECLWFITHYEVEWGSSSGRMRLDVVNEFGHGYLFSPF